MEHQTTEIRQIGQNELQNLQNISIKTFAETFESSNSEQNMKEYIQSAFLLSKLENELQNPNSNIYFIQLGSQICGYMKLNFHDAQSEIRDAQAMEVERIYVLQEFQGNKLGKSLMEFAIRFATERNLNYLWLGVWEHNVKAISFYEKFGFAKFDEHVFQMGNEAQTDILMRRFI